MEIQTLELKSFINEQGGLVPIEALNNVPFKIDRIYYVFDVPRDSRRGFHAHKKTRQFAICVKGSCTFLMDDGESKADVVLNRPDKGLIIEPMIWHEMHNFSKDCLLLVLADTFYDESDYIRDYKEFRRLL